VQPKGSYSPDKDPEHFDYAQYKLRRGELVEGHSRTDQVLIQFFFGLYLISCFFFSSHVLSCFFFPVPRFTLHVTRSLLFLFSRPTLHVLSCFFFFQLSIFNRQSSFIVMGVTPPEGPETPSIRQPPASGSPSARRKPRSPPRTWPPRQPPPCPARAS